MSNYQAALDENPSGILIYKPAGEKAITVSQLLHEFGFQVFESLLLAILLSMTALKTFGSRLGFALVVGVDCSRFYESFVPELVRISRQLHAPHHVCGGDEIHRRGNRYCTADEKGVG
jgi:hypothetical protein